MWKVPFGPELNNAGESGRLRTFIETILVPSIFAMLGLQILGRWRNPFSTTFMLPSWSWSVSFSSYTRTHGMFTRENIDESPFFGTALSRRSSMHLSLCGSWAFVSSFLDASLPLFEWISARHQDSESTTEGKKPTKIHTKRYGMLYSCMMLYCWSFGTPAIITDWLYITQET